jgi:hypothetical protein
MTNKPYDATTHSNPWLMKCSGSPINDATGHPLTPEYIWSKQGAAREELLEWVFSYYRKTGYPVFKLTDAELKKDFEDLKKKDPNDILENGVIKNSNTVGLDAAKHFTSDLFSAVKGTKTISCLDAFNDDSILKKVLKNRMGWNTSKEDGSERPYVFGINDKMIVQGFRSSAQGHAVSHFKPLIAKYVYNKYSVKSTLDYSCGWGARAVGALCLGAEYYGIDPLTSDRVSQIIKYFGGSGFCVKNGSELIDYSIFPDVDLCFSCPPYFDLEIYSNDTMQSSRHKQYNDWLELYWTPTVNKCFPKCKLFGFVAVQNVRKNNLLEDMNKICLDAGGILIEDTPIKVSKSHLSGKAQNKSVDKKTEHLMIYKVRN